MSTLNSELHRYACISTGQFDAGYCEDCLSTLSPMDMLVSVASRMAALILRIPCDCEESHDGSINKRCDVCAAYMDWEEVMHHV